LNLFEISNSSRSLAGFMEEQNVEYWKKRALEAERAIKALISGDEDAKIESETLVNLIGSITDSIGVFAVTIGETGIHVCGGAPQVEGAEEVAELLNRLQNIVSEELNGQFKRVGQVKINPDGSREEISDLA
jgi:hypothetical protein